MVEALIGVDNKRDVHRRPFGFSMEQAPTEAMTTATDLLAPCIPDPLGDPACHHSLPNTCAETVDATINTKSGNNRMLLLIEELIGSGRLATRKTVAARMLHERPTRYAEHKHQDWPKGKLVRRFDRREFNCCTCKRLHKV